MGLYTFGVRAQVPGFQHTMALCPHLGYLILIDAPFGRARRHLKQVELCSKYKALDSPGSNKNCVHIDTIFSTESQGRDLVQGHCTGTLECGRCRSELENGCVYISVQGAPYSGHLARAIRKENGGSRGLGKLKTDL